MNPKMSNHELLDVLVYIRKGPRVIDRTETDWGEAFLRGHKYYETFVYTKAELRDCLGSFKFDRWWNNPDRWIEPTLEAAILFADDAASGRSEKAAARHEEAVLERRINDLEGECQSLQSRCVHIIGEGLFVQDPPRLATIQLSRQERFEKALENRDRLLKELAERPALAKSSECMQLDLEVTRSSDTIPPWQR